MASTALIRQSSLQGEAIERAHLAFSKLPNEDARFQQYLNSSASLSEVVNSVALKAQFHKGRTGTKLLQQFHQYTLWLKNISEVIGIVVQTQAGIGCPLWAPIKFVLDVSDDHIQAVEMILCLVQTIFENMPRLNIYEKLPSDPALDIALLQVFTDVVEFSVLSLRYFERRRLARAIRLFINPLKEDFGNIMKNIKRHTIVVDSTALAIEMRKAEDFRKKMTERDIQNLKLQIEGWLKPSNVRAIQESQIQTKLHGTCEWIESNPTFKSWNEGMSLCAKDRLLCIHGTHGCGKSILASSIIEKFQKNHQRILHFSFSGTDKGMQSFEGLVRSFLWQLLEHRIDEESLERLRSLMLKGPFVLSELWDCFKSLAKLLSVPIYCVVDGVDECCDPVQVIENHFLELLTSQNDFKAILIGRSHILQTVKESQVIEMSSDVTSQDIETYISAEIAKHHILQNPKVKDLVIETLREESEGMFLWLNLMIQDLGKSATAAQVKERLRNLPPGLENAYCLHFSRLLERLDKYELAIAKTILTFTVCCHRLLNIDELRYAIALSSCHSSPFEDHLLEEPGRRILDICGGLIHIKDDVVDFVHFSVQEFLTRPQDQWCHENELKIMGFRVDEEDSNGSLGSICVHYLSMCDFYSPLSDTDTFSELAPQYPFLNYASIYVFSHLSSSGTTHPDILQRIKYFLLSDTFTPWLEYLSMLVLEQGVFFTLWRDIDYFLDWLDESNYNITIFVQELQARLNSELQRRKRAFGSEDPRTEQWSSFQSAFKTLLPYRKNIAASSTAMTIYSNSSEKKPKNLSMLSRIMDMLSNTETLPLNQQVDLFLRLESEFQGTKTYNDSLEDMCNLVYEKASIMPIYALLATSAFHTRFGRSVKGVRIYYAAGSQTESNLGYSTFEVLEYIGDHIMKRQQKYQDAEVLYREILKITKNMVGKYYDDRRIIIYGLTTVLQHQGKYHDAEIVLRELLDRQERTLGKEHKDTLKTMYWLGDVLKDQGKYHDAEVVLRELLDRQERTLGKEHKDTLYTMKWLGYVLKHQRKYYDAEVVFRELLDCQERTLGRDDEDTLYTMYWLGVVLKDQGKYHDAEVVLRELLDRQERTLGKEHKDTLKTMHWLGDVLEDQGKYHDAEVIFRELLDLQERTLGRDDEDTLYTMKWLGVVLKDQGKYHDAEVVLRELLDRQERTLGRDDEDTLLTMKRLSYILEDQGKYHDAEVVLRELLDLQERTLGRDDEDTLYTMKWLGYVLKHQRKYYDAEVVFRELLDCQEINLGKCHIKTRETMCHLIITLKEQKKHQETELFFRKFLAQRNNILAIDHECTQYSFKCLARSLQEQGLDEEASIIYKNLLKRSERALGREHPQSRHVLFDLAESFRRQKLNAAASVLFQDLLERETNALEKDRDTHKIMRNILAILQRLGNCHEAEIIIRRVLECHARILGMEHEGTLCTTYLLGLNLQHQKRYCEAEALYKTWLESAPAVYRIEHPNIILVMRKLEEFLKCRQELRIKSTIRQKPAITIFGLEISVSSTGALLGNKMTITERNPLQIYLRNKRYALIMSSRLLHPPPRPNGYFESGADI